MKNKKYPPTCEQGLGFSLRTTKADRVVYVAVRITLSSSATKRLTTWKNGREDCRGKINETKEETQTRSLTELRLLDGDNERGTCRGNNIGESMFGEAAQVFRGGRLHHLLFFIKVLCTLNNSCELRNTLSAEVIISLLPRFNVRRFIYASADFGVFMLIKTLQAAVS